MGTFHPLIAFALVAGALGACSSDEVSSEPSASSEAGAGGAGASGSSAGSGGEGGSAGQGGAAGASGSATTVGCEPGDPRSVEQAPCAIEGEVCGGCVGGCTFCYQVRCEAGSWAHLAQAPDPSCPSMSWSCDLGSGPSPDCATACPAGSPPKPGAHGPCGPGDAPKSCLWHEGSGVVRESCSCEGGDSLWECSMN